MESKIDNDDYLEDEWETVVIPDLLGKKESERERQILEERKLMEEADAALAEDLFLNNKAKIQDTKIQDTKIQDTRIQVTRIQNKQTNIFKPIIKIDLQQINIENQKQESERLKKIKEDSMRIKEIYGEAEIDVYDELYGHIADPY